MRLAGQLFMNESRWMQLLVGVYELMLATAGQSGARG